MSFSGCVKYSSPSELIGQPEIPKEEIKACINTESKSYVGDRIEENEDIEDNIEDIAENYFSYNEKLLSPDKIINNKSVYNMDLDGDNKKEIFGFSEIEGKNPKIHFFVLKKKNNKWNNIYKNTIRGKSISFLKIIKMYDKEQISIIIGGLISEYKGSEYTTYTLGNISGVNCISNIGTWNRFEVLSDLSIADSNGFIFAAWLKDKCDLYKVNIIKFDPNNRSYTPAEYLYRDYFKNVIQYNKNVLSKNDNIELSWYYLIYSEIKAGKYKEALNTIDEVVKLKKSGCTLLKVEDYKFNLLKAKALDGLKRYDEAEEVLLLLLDNLNTDAINNKIFNLEKQNDTINYEDELSIADIYCQLAKVYFHKDNKDKEKKALEKSYEVIKELSKKTFYKENDTADIMKDLIYYPVIFELNRLNKITYPNKNDFWS
jgi:hypothetical protein